MRLTHLIGSARRNVLLGLELMRRTSREEFEWLDSIEGRITAGGRPCGCGRRTIACTWVEPNGSITIAFHVNPSSMSVPEIATSLRHEARHYAPDLDGDGLVEVPHRCSDDGCQNPYERAFDPIYQADGWFGRLYEHVWLTSGHHIERFIDRLERQRRAKEAEYRAEAARRVLRTLGTAGLFIGLLALVSGK